MSDFLNNFKKDKYPENSSLNQKSESQRKELKELHKVKESKQAWHTDQKEKLEREREEEIEFDPAFKKKRIKKWGIIAGVSGLLTALLFFAYYQWTHVTLPDFVSKEVSDARSWLSENNLILETEQAYNDNAEINLVLEQGQKAGKKVKKGSKVQLTVSQGPDPNALLELPDFMTMTKSQAEEWKSMNKAENITFIDEYNDSVESGKAAKVEFNNKDVTGDTYQRKEKVKIYFSKGKEVFEKNITVPDFVSKAKAEAETWAKTNEISVTYEEQTSNTAEADMIISQSISKDEKIAKKESMTVVVSLGKGFTVPDFSGFTPEESASAAEGLTIQTSTVFSESVPYGRLISQSVEAGTALSSKDSLVVKVVYSIGKPYMKNIIGTMLECDLPKYFYEEFQIKGADITYQCRYADSAEMKGTVIGTSVVNGYLPLKYNIAVDISKGNIVPEGE